MASALSPANNFDELTFANPLLTTIASDAKSSFDLIIALSKVTINDNVTMKIIGRIQEQALTYWDTIKDSSVTGTDSYTTSGEAIDFCTQLEELDPLDANSKEIITELIEDLKDSAQKCLTSCKEAKEKFISVLGGFTEILKDVQAKVETETTNEPTVKVREAKPNDLGNELKDVAMKLSELGEAIKRLDEWWTGTTTVLTMVATATDKVKVSVAMRGKVAAIREHWTKSKNDFDTYNNAIINLQYIYARERLERGPGPEPAASPEIGSTLTALVSSAGGSLSLITALCEVSTDHAAVTKVIENIRERRLQYWDAIDNSVTTATDGHATGSEAIAFCIHLEQLDPLEEASKEIIQKLIEDLKDSAQKCLDNCKEAEKKFGDINDGLAQISRDVQAKIETETTPLLAVKDAISGDLQEVKLSDLGNELQGVATKLQVLSDTIRMFVVWWTDMATALLSVVSASDKVKASVAMRSKAAIIRERWSTIKNDFDAYNRTITQLRDSYPRKMFDDPENKREQA